MHSRNGFTLIELMMALAIASILLAIAAPNMASFLRTNSLRAQTAKTVGAIKFARAEAVKRRATVILCRTADPTAESPSCGGAANTWTSGYLIFVSGDTNSTYEPSTDTLVRVGPAAPSAVDVLTSAACNRNLEYDSDGTTDEDGNACFMSICDDRGDDNGYLIRVRPTGRPDVLYGSDGDVNCSSPGA